MNSREKYVLSAMVFLAILLSGTSIPCLSTTRVPAPKVGGTISMGSVTVVKHFVQVVGSGGCYFLSMNIFDRLVDIGLDGSKQPGLAYKWESSPDLKTWTFYLVKNATWHDGKKFTSADVKFTIEGINQFQHPGTSYLQNIDHVETPDDYTAVLKLKIPDAVLPDNVGSWTGYTSILPKHIYEGTDWKTNPATIPPGPPVGTGAFKFESYTPGTYTVVANEKYHWGRPYLDRIVQTTYGTVATEYLALEKGEIDYAIDVPAYTDVARLLKVPHLNVAFDPMAQQQASVLWINVNRAPLNNVNVRKALLYGIDREEINTKAYGGYCKSGQGPYAPSTLAGKPFWPFNPNTKYPSYDPAMAEKLLDEAGFPRKADGYRFGIKLVVNYRWTDLEHAATVVKGNLDKIGIKITGVDLMDYTTWLEAAAKKHDFDLTFTAVYQGPDPFWLRSLYRTDEFENAAGWSNKEYDEISDKSIATADRDQRIPHIYKMQEILLRELPAIVLIEKMIPLATNKKFHGFWFEPQTISHKYDFTNVWSDEGKPITPTTTAATTRVTTTTTPTTTTTDTLTYVAAAIAVGVIIAAIVLFRKRKASSSR